MPHHQTPGPELYRRRAWAAAYDAFASADEASPLDVEDLQLWANAAYLAGRDEDFARISERVHHLHRQSGDDATAARVAFWIGLSLLFRGETGRASGWLGRAQRLIQDRDCVEQGYVLLPTAEQQFRAREYDAALEAVRQGARIGERFGDVDLVCQSRHLEGRVLIQRGQLREGLALLDEVMVAVTAGELSPISTGLLYCSVIEACQHAYAVARAREWTEALSRWCGEQPEMVAFTATCLVRRAEILQLRGAWSEAIEEAQRACERVAAAPDRRPPAAAFYQQGEIHRLRGEFAKADEAYRATSDRGSDPHPGLALLRLAQGRTEQAAAGIRRAVGTAVGDLPRTKLLPAFVEIMLAAEAMEEARAACTELEAIAGRLDASAVVAMAAHGRGQLQLVEGDAQAALNSLRRAGALWREVHAPYHTARTRVLMGLACRALGDEDGCALELQAARSEFERLGAAPDLARLEQLTGGTADYRTHGLSARQLEVLRLVAAGRTNRSIAKALGISDKTVARHVSNIFAKLGLSTRAAATAYAYEHDLV